MAGSGGGTTLDCPRCGTTYRLFGRGAERDATYECAKCHEVFGPGAEDDGWRDEPDEDEAFRFDDEAPPRRVPPPRNRATRVSAPPDEPPEDDDVLVEGGDEDEPPSAASRRRRRRAPADTDEEKSPGVARFALRGLIAVTLSYAVLSVWASTHREEFQRRLGRIPLIGQHLAESSVDPNEVALRDVRGEYDYLKSGELAFVVRGTAVNLGRGPLRRVRVEGRVGGAGEMRQLASCTDAPADVRRTSRQMLMLMENVRETRPAVVPAGGSAACEVVFVDPPRPVTELSLAVVSVLGD